METPQEDDIITNSDESRILPDENPEPLEGIKKEESNLLKDDPEPENKKGKPEQENQPKRNDDSKKELK